MVIYYQYPIGCPTRLGVHQVMKTYVWVFYGVGSALQNSF